MLTFHCGLPKTGSTFLQRDVFPYAQGGTYISAKHPFTYLVNSLAEVEQNGRPALISDEALTWTPLQWEDLAKRKRERKLEYIVRKWPGSRLLLFLREPSEMVRAHYAQYLHHGGFRDFEDFCAHHFHPDAFRFDLLLDRIAEMPWDRVLLIEYLELREQPERAVELIGSFAGMRFPGWQEGQRKAGRNISVDGYGARLLRLSNAYFIRGYPEHGIGMPRGVLRRRSFVRRLIQPGPLRFLNRCGPELVPAETLERVREQYAPSWAAAQERIAASRRELSLQA